MGKVSAPGTLPLNPIQRSGGEMKVNSGIRRKTPSELRREQLRRKTIIELQDESSVSNLGVTRGESQDLKRRDLPRVPRFIEARMDEVYPLKKCRFRMPAGKENAKDYTSTEEAGKLRNISLISNLDAKRRDQITGLDMHTSSKVAKDDMLQGRQTIKECSQNVFHTVVELSSRAKSLSDLDNVNMDKALKGLVTCEPFILSGSHGDASKTNCKQRSANPSNFYSEYQISAPKAPLDLTLKTSVRITCSFSMKWFHRLLTSDSYYMMPQFSSQYGVSKDQHMNHLSGSAMSASSFNPKALQSWVYPKSPLPVSLISTLTLSTKYGAEMDFLNERQANWVDAFRCLYYMLRKNMCHIFYVCTSHFVVMFTGDDTPGRIVRSCNAYISQSSRLLRSLLKENDVCFSMPLCHSNVEQVTAEDLVELSEIEKHNLGQTRRVNSSCDIDNSPQSLLVFSGNKNVHGLYDFLLNYRSSMTFLAGVDVPVLYSPAQFQYSVLSTPKVQYMETKTTPQISASAKGSDLKETGTLPVPSSPLCCSIEFKDAYLPPWFISSVIATVSSEGKSFEASFTTEPTSVALNVALKTVCNNSEPQPTGSESLHENNYSFGIPETTVAPNLFSSTIRELKYCNGSFTASLLPV